MKVGKRTRRSDHLGCGRAQQLITELVVLTSPDISPVCGIMAERFCPRFVLATKDVVDATSAGARANLGQNIRPEAAKRTVVQTATLDMGVIFMPINKLHANESVLVQYPG